jgi:hypothetical protein
MTEACADVVMARYCRNRAAGQTESQSKRKRPGPEKPSHSIEDPLPFKNFDEGALHLKRFASRCTNGAGGRSLEIEVLPARRRWGRGVLLPGQRYRGHSFSSVQRGARLEQAGCAGSAARMGDSGAVG